MVIWMGHGPLPTRLVLSGFLRYTDTIGLNPMTPPPPRLLTIRLRLS